jgi:LysW-gamma-L-alpha-aminoadipyl-6-phosphate/LysW-L-glutamyl-5-phosphate reductase
MARKVSIVGASGYTGGELLRWALIHPEMEVAQLTSERFAGIPVTKLNPNLRGFTQKTFESVKTLNTDVDALFLCLPHKVSAQFVKQYLETGVKIIDLSADFRIHDKDVYAKYYQEHPCPELLPRSVYGIPELHRDEIRNAQLVSCGGCLATSIILATAPLVKAGLIDNSSIIADSKIGSSASGAAFDISTHHPERQGTVRGYKPSGHRHTAEIEQELGAIAAASGSGKVSVGMTPHAVEMVRGIFSTVHVRPKAPLKDLDVWKAYRSFYTGSPFVRLVKDKETVFRYPEPKCVIGSNFADIGFEIDAERPRMIIMSVIDNLVKGSGGQAIQNFNLMFNLDEKAGIWQPGFHPM